MYRLTVHNFYPSVDHQRKVFELCRLLKTPWQLSGGQISIEGSEKTLHVMAIVLFQSHAFDITLERIYDETGAW